MSGFWLLGLADRAVVEKVGDDGAASLCQPHMGLRTPQCQRIAGFPPLVRLSWPNISTSISSKIYVSGRQE
jgi:hypothetical protein